MAVRQHVRSFLTLPDPLPFDPIAEAQRQWRKHWGTGPVASMSAVTSIMRVEQILISRLNALLNPWDLTFPRYEALMLLYYSRRGSLPLGKMGDRLQVHRTSVTNIIDGLERSGFVTREPHERDRRTTLAAITARGREVAATVTPILNDLRFGTEPLGRDDLDAVTTIFERLRADSDGFTPARQSGS
jgi:DNA-binding MarR family transcriptional regulator